jgi:hypothetical protein
METPTSGIQLELLKNRLALRTFICATLARQLQTARLVEKPAITIRWQETLKECQILQLTVELLERKEREKNALQSAGTNGAASRQAASASLSEIQ